MAAKIHKLDKIWKAIKQSKEKRFKELKSRFVELEKEIIEQRLKIKTLEKEGVEFGTPSWKTQVTREDGTRKEYMRILSENGGNKYIGCKTEKVEKAQADILRGIEHKSLIRNIQSNVNELDDIESEIEEL